MNTLQVWCLVLAAILAVVIWFPPAIRYTWKRFLTKICGEERSELRSFLRQEFPPRINDYMGCRRRAFVLEPGWTRSGKTFFTILCPSCTAARLNEEQAQQLASKERQRESEAKYEAARRERMTKARTLTGAAEELSRYIGDSDREFCEQAFATLESGIRERKQPCSVEQLTQLANGCVALLCRTHRKWAECGYYYHPSEKDKQDAPYNAGLHGRAMAVIEAMCQQSPEFYNCLTSARNALFQEHEQEVRWNVGPDVDGHSVHLEWVHKDVIDSLDALPCMVRKKSGV